MRNKPIFDTNIHNFVGFNNCVGLDVVKWVCLRYFSIISVYLQ